MDVDKTDVSQNLENISNPCKNDELKTSLAWIEVWGTEVHIFVLQITKDLPHDRWILMHPKQHCWLFQGPLDPGNKTFWRPPVENPPVFWDVHPGKLTWKLGIHWIHHWKRNIIFQTIIFRFYVNLRGVYDIFLCLFWQRIKALRNFKCYRCFKSYPRKKKARGELEFILVAIMDIWSDYLLQWNPQLYTPAI